MSRIRIGWASRDVSSSEPVNMSGQFHMRISRGIMDPLTVTAMVLENNGVTSVFVSGDMIDCRSHILDELRERVAARYPQLDPRRIVLNATHTHTAITHVGGIGSISFTKGEAFNHDGVEIGSSEDYRNFLVDNMVDAVCEAYETRAEGGISYGYGFAVVAFSRRVVYFDDLSKRPGAVQDANHGVDGHVRMYGDTSDPNFSHYEAGADPFVNLMFTFDSDDKLTGAVINIPCPSQNSEDEYYQSADYWHDIRTAIRKKYGDIFILPQCAAAGDLSPRQLHYQKAQQRRYRLKYGEIDTVADNKTEIMNRLEIAERVCQCFDDVYSWARKEIDHEPVLRHKVQTVVLPKRMVTEEEYERTKENFAAVQDSAFTYDGTPPENLHHNSILMSMRGRCRRIMNRYENQAEDRELPMELHTVRVGDIAFATNRFELFMDYEHRIQGRSSFLQTFIVQLVAQPDVDNGSYLPTERGLWGKGFGASIFDNQVTPEAGQIIVEETVRSLHELAQA